MKSRLARRRKLLIDPIATANAGSDARGKPTWRDSLMALCEVETVSVEVPEAEAIGFGEKLHVASTGSPEQKNDMSPEKPLIAVVVTVVAAASPLLMFKDAGLSAIVKTGAV